MSQLLRTARSGTVLGGDSTALSAESRSLLRVCSLPSLRVPEAAASYCLGRLLRPATTEGPRRPAALQDLSLTHNSPKELLLARDTPAPENISCYVRSVCVCVRACVHACVRVCVSASVCVLCYARRGEGGGEGPGGKGGESKVSASLMKQTKYKAETLPPACPPAVLYFCVSVLQLRGAPFGPLHVSRQMDRRVEGWGRGVA